MPRPLLSAAVVSLVLCPVALLPAQDVRIVEKDGVQMRETRQIVRKPVVETRIEQRERTVYRDRFTTDMKPVERTYVVPITEYQWAPQWENSWNPFSPPSLVYRQVPVTRWETRKETVRIPVTRRELVPEKLVDQVPVTRQSIAEQEIITRVQVGPSATSSIAKSPDPFGAAPNLQPLAQQDPVGGVSKLDSDPPREGAAWKPAGSMTRR